METAIQKRIDRFTELHKNKWFHVMNWVLDSLLIKDEQQRRIHRMSAHTFYFDSKLPW